MAAAEEDSEEGEPEEVMPMAKKKAHKSTGRSLAKGKARSPRKAVPTRLLGDIRSLIEQARQQTARAVNSALVELYWRIGKRIRKDVLHEQRAEYGKEILSTLSKELQQDYGSGFSVPNLSRMMQLAERFPDERIVAALSQQLSWSHFIERKLLDAIRLARERIARQTTDRPPTAALPAPEKPARRKSTKRKRS